MAAVVIALRRQSTQLLSHEEALRRTNRRSTISNLDQDDDNYVCHKEMQERLGDILIRAHFILGRLNFERAMCQMMVKLPMFILGFSCFLAALIEFAPAAITHDVHRHLKHHFDLEESLGSVKDVEQIYMFMERFEQRNEEMQATSAKYWCEHRYIKRTWDEKLAVPVTSCNSPRQYALSLTKDDSSSWTATQNKSVQLHHRRMGSVPAAVPASVPACDDFDEKLQNKTNDMNTTCALAAIDSHHKVCEEDLGILLCPKTCGFCSPFTYDHRNDFTKPQVTLLPISIFQTRFTMSDCHGFAHRYEEQPHNPVLTLLPALDGERKGRVLTCIDRNKHVETEYSHEVPCPPRSPPAQCPDGKLRYSRKHQYHGIAVYPKMLIEPHRDVEAMKSIQWIDMQTETLTLTTLVYTEDIELFTLLEVEFKADRAGNIDGSYTMISYRDMIGQARFIFIGCLCVCMTTSVIALVFMAYRFFRWGMECAWGYFCYELCSRVVMLVYPAILLLTWFQQVPMADEYDQLLHTFLDIGGISESHIDGAMDQYFEVLSHVYAEVSWLKKHRIAGCLVVYSQFIQFIFYMNAHPKMASLTATVMKSLNNLMHFMLLFVMIFAMLAFMAHWMLGEHIDEFGSYRHTLISQTQMFFGEFIKAEDADELHGPLLVMYWVYAWTFMLVIWLLLLNFLLAIIVDAFVEVKESLKDLVFISDIARDCVRVCHTRITALRYRWPSQSSLIEFFERVIEDANENSKRRTLARMMAELNVSNDGENVEEDEQGPTCQPAEIMDMFQELGTDFRCTRFLLHYYRLYPDIIALRAKVRNSSKMDDDAQIADPVPESCSVTVAESLGEPDASFGSSPIFMSI